MLKKLERKLQGFYAHPRERMTITKEIIKELWLIAKQPLFYLCIGLLFFLILTPIFTYIFFIRDIGSKERIMHRNNAGVVLLDRNEKPFFTFYQAKTESIVSFDQIPDAIKNAVVSSEDKDFYRHPGISPTSIIRAALADIRNEEFSQGGSTITQQLIKNTLLGPEKTFLRKYQEAILALEVDRRYSKNDVLEMYLNTVYFGEGAFGVEDAARAYFGEHASQLTLAQSALLAGILPAPSAFSPISGDRNLAFQKQHKVLAQMVTQGYITKEQAQTAENEQVAFNPQQKELNVRAPHFALMVKDELVKKYGEQQLARSGYIVKTTIDLDAQEYAEQAVKNQVQRLTYNKATNGAAIAMDPKTGEILTLVGSHDWFDENNGKINMALHPRQPGSSFKPIIYADALREQLITAATVLDDKPITFPGGYKPHDYDYKFRGQVLARDALANSLNIPALHVMERVGVQDGVAFARKMGVTALDPNGGYGISLVLGAGEIPLIQMVDAYAVFASQGYLPTPTTIIEVRDKNNHTIFTNSPKRTYVLKPSVAYIITSILSDNKARAAEFGNALTISRPAAVKTGTTEDFRDALTLGYTPNLVVGVWVGNNDNAPMDSVAGSLGAAPIWRQIMQKFFLTLPDEPFTKPFSIEEQAICKDSGKKAEVATSSAYLEYFLPGTVPTQTCTSASPIPNPNQPTDEEATPTYMILPDEPSPTEEQNDQPTTTPTPTQTSTTSPTPSILPTSLPIPTL